MDRTTTWLVLLGAGAYAGAGCGGRVAGAVVPLAAAAALAVAAALVSWRARALTRSAAWSVIACTMSAASLSADAAVVSALDTRPSNPARGVVIGVEGTARGWALVLEAGRTRWRIGVPRTGDARLDAWPPGAGPGARVEVPLRDDPRTAAGCRALAPATIRVLAPATAWDRAWSAGERLAAAFRARTRERLVRGPDDPVGAFLLASVAGDGHALDAATWRALRASGLAHIAVVSGFNVSLLALAAAGSAAPLGGAHHPRRRVAALLAVGVLLVVLPGDPPVRRACAALLVARAGRLAARGTPPAGALGSAVLFLLALDPRLASSLSFALTVAATFAITLAASSARGLRGAAAVFIAPTLATWPLLVTATGRVSPWSPLANLLAAPAVFPSLAAGWIAVLLPDGAAGAIAIAAAAARASTRVILGVAQELACWPRSGGLAAPGGPCWPIVHGALLALCFALLHAGPRLPPRVRRALLAAALVAVVASTLWPLRDAREVPGSAGLDVLDVGQGQALLLETGGAEPVLIDAADDRTPQGVRALLAQLRERGITRLGLLALTHADRDHSGGAAEVISALAPRRLALPEGAVDSPQLRPAVSDATRRGIPLRVLAAGDRLVLDRLQFTVLHPRPGQRGDDNDHALVVRVNADWVTALLTSDADERIEADLARRGLLPATDVVVAGHHGSRSCTSAALLARTRPFVVPISCGVSNSYGHPHREVLRRLDRVECAVVRTDTDGPIHVRARGERRLLVTAGTRISRVLLR